MSAAEPFSAGTAKGQALVALREYALMSSRQ